MTKFTIKTKNCRHEISLKNYKVLLGDNYLEKFEIFNTILKIFANANMSEYSIEEDIHSYFHINDDEIRLKEWEIIKLQNDFDLTVESKFGTKTLTYMYFQSLYQRIDEHEIVSTINTLIEELNEELNDKNETHMLVNPEIEKLNLKHLLKLTKPLYTKNEFLTNAYDYTYFEKIYMQLDMIKKISEVNYAKNYIVLIDIFHIDEDLINYIESLSFENLFFLVNVNTRNIMIDYNKVYNISRKYIDFANEVDLYNELVLLSETKIFVDDLKPILNDYIMGNDTEEVERIKKLL